MRRALGCGQPRVAAHDHVGEPVRRTDVGRDDRARRPVRACQAARRLAEHGDTLAGHADAMHDVAGADLARDDDVGGRPQHLERRLGPLLVALAGRVELGIDDRQEIGHPDDEATLRAVRRLGAEHHLDDVGALGRRRGEAAPERRAEERRRVHPHRALEDADVAGEDPDLAVGVASG